LVTKLNVGPSVDITARLIKLLKHLFEYHVSYTIRLMLYEELYQILAADFLNLLITFFERNKKLRDIFFCDILDSEE